ncbi:response regulator [Paenibacillus rigui]|nr:response regulator [Paenibacillus rigui]
MHLTQPLSIMVVDDELPLREELRLFPWQDYGAELIGEAENGEEALALCRKLKPDVVITDITMPVMDGMDLFRIIKREFPLTQVVLLTCHSDFAYAKEALKLGALEYLVKVSLLDTELEQVLDKARDAIQREHNYRRSELDKQRWELSRLLSRSTEEGHRDRNLSLVASTIQLWKTAFPLRIVRIHVNVTSQEEMFAHRELQACLSEWELSPSPESLSRRWAAIGPSDYMLLFQECAGSGKPDSFWLQYVGAWLTQLQKTLDANISYLSQPVSLYAVIGAAVPRVEEMPSALRQSELPAACLFYDPSGSVYDADTIGAFHRERGKEPFAENTAPENFDMLTEQLREAAQDKASLARYYRETLTDWVQQSRPDRDLLKLWLVSVRKEWMGSKEAAIQQELIRKLHNARTFAELISLLIRELEVRAGGKQRLRKEVACSIQLIADHLAEPITLTWAAEQVGLSSFYLSRLFREEVGESFNEFVTRQRIDKAIHLLQTTRLKVYEVAEQVGIPSYRYFSVLFRNRTGVAPSEYKKGGVE